MTFRPLDDVLVPSVTEVDRQRARRAVIRLATDEDDAQLLLQMLGLAGEEFAPCPGNANWYRKNRCRCQACTRAWAERRAKLRAEAKEKVA